jgi:hypothetical protein
MLGQRSTIKGCVAAELEVTVWPPPNVVATEPGNATTRAVFIDFADVYAVIFHQQFHLFQWALSSFSCLSGE